MNSNADGGLAAPVISGLAAGIGLIAIFVLASNQTLSHDAVIYANPGTPSELKSSEYSIAISKLDGNNNNLMLIFSILPEITRAADNSVTYFSSGYSDTITEREAKHLMRMVQFTDVSEYLSDNFQPSIIKVYDAMIELDGKYYRLRITSVRGL